MRWASLAGRAIADPFFPAPIPCDVGHTVSNLSVAHPTSEC